MSKKYTLTDGMIDGMRDAQLTNAHWDTVTANQRANAAEAREEELRRLSNRLSNELQQTRAELEAAYNRIREDDEALEESLQFRRTLGRPPLAEARLLFTQIRGFYALEKVRDNLLAQVGLSAEIRVTRERLLSDAKLKLNDAKTHYRAMAEKANASQAAAAAAVSEYNATSSLRMLKKRSLREEAERLTEVANNDANVARTAQAAAAQRSEQVKIIQARLESQSPALIEELSLEQRRSINLHMIAETEWLWRSAHEQAPLARKMEQYLAQKAELQESLPHDEARRLSDRLAELRELIDNDSSDAIKTAWVEQRAALLQQLAADGRLEYDADAALPRGASLPPISDLVPTDYTAVVDISWFNLRNYLAFL